LTQESSPAERLDPRSRCTPREPADHRRAPCTGTLLVV